MKETLLLIFDALRLRKARALMFFLVADANRPHRTEKLHDLFWQGVDRERAAVSCRQVVHQIRLALADCPDLRLETGNGRMTLEMPPGVSLSTALLSGLSQGSWSDSAADAIRGYLGLIDQIAGVSPSFDSWLTITQTALISRLRSQLDVIMAKAGGHSDEGRHFAEFAIEIEPSNEGAARYLMMHYWLSGRATRAIEVYNTLYAHLGDQFDQEPEPETVALLAAIKLEPARALPVPVAQTRPQVRIAVVLFPEPASGPESAVLSSVLNADLRMRLSRFREWRVTEASDPEPPEVSLLLRPALAGTEPRVYVEVVEGRSGAMLWSERIDDPARDWETNVRLLLISVASALSVVIADRSLSDPAAGIYDRWLRSQVLLDRWSPDTEASALDMLREITREAPRFGPAHAELAGALNVRHVLLPGTRQTDDVKEAALHHAIEAVSIDPLDTRAHRVLAWCYAHKREFDLAEFHFEQAVSLNPSNSLTLASAALGFAFSGNFAQSARLVLQTRQHSAAMEPFHLIYVAVADYLCGNYAAAAAEFGAGSGLMTTVGGWHSAALWQLGQPAAAQDRLLRWFDEIRKSWRGSEPATGALILDWFTQIFPLRDERVRENLRATLDHAARVMVVRA